MSDNKTLKDTVDGMLSDDYKERFKAEFDQLGIRAMSLWNMLQNWKNLEVTPDCSKDILQEQNDIQWLEIRIMKRRAHIEHIHLDWDPVREKFEAKRVWYQNLRKQRNENKTTDSE